MMAVLHDRIVLVNKSVRVRQIMRHFKCLFPFLGLLFNVYCIYGSVDKTWIRHYSQVGISCGAVYTFGLSRP